MENIASRFRITQINSVPLGTFDAIYRLPVAVVAFLPVLWPISKNGVDQEGVFDSDVRGLIISKLEGEHGVGQYPKYYRVGYFFASQEVMDVYGYSGRPWQKYKDPVIGERQVFELY
jgi:hypothetical protein